MNNLLEFIKNGVVAVAVEGWTVGSLLLGTIMLSIMGVVLFMLYTNSWVPMTLGLILLFINVSLILLLLDLEFLGMIYLVVYIGAVCVLFLFVIILLNLRTMDKAQAERKGLVFLAFCLSIISIKYVVYTKQNLEVADTTLVFVKEDIIKSLVYFLGNNVYLFILLGLILLLSILLPVMLTKNMAIGNYTKRQELVYSNFKTIKSAILVKSNVKADEEERLKIFKDRE